MSVSILFMGPVGAGKTQAIRSLTAGHALETEQRASGAARALKPTTTVAMDLGSLPLAGRPQRLRLLGAPGQERFGFMREILLRQAHGVMLLLHHGSADPLGDLARHLAVLALRPTPLPLVLAITHTDLAPQRPVQIYADYLAQHGGAPCPPVLPMDARDPRQVQAALLALTARLGALRGAQAPVPALHTPWAGHPAAAWVGL